MALRNNPGSDLPLAWSGGFLKYPEELDGVACTDTSCLAVSNTRTASAIFVSQVYRSTDGGATWSDGVALDSPDAIKTRSALGISCDPAGACYIVGPGGGVWRSLDDGRSWKALDVPRTPASFRRVDCPAPGTCVAVGGDKVGSSAVIDGTTVTPVALPPGTGKGILGLACDRATRCTATDGLGRFMSMSVPDKKWGPVKLFPKAAVVSALACPIEDVCVGLTGGLALRTTTLSSDTGGWQKRPLASLNLTAITCAQQACIAVGKKGSWFASFDAGFNWGRVNEVGKFDAIQCSAAFSPTCVAGGEKDVGVTHTSGELWALPLSGYTGLNIKAVNCTGLSECLLLGKGLTLFTDDLIAFQARHPTIIEAKGTDALTCITKTLCVGVNEGVVYTTLDGAVTDWTHDAFTGGRPVSVACLPGRTDPAECLVATTDFIYLGTMTQAGGIHWNFLATDANPSEGLTAVGCSTGGLCTAVGAGGEILNSNGTDLMSWTEQIVPDPTEPVLERPLWSSVACPADGVCLAGGVHGSDAVIASTADNWKNFAYDAIPGIEGDMPTVKAFGCESVNRCVAVGGTSLVGVRTGG